MLDYANLIKDIGFPIIVSFFLLIKIEKQLQVFSESIKELTNVINNLQLSKDNKALNSDNNLK